jgi:hypothetical protein
MPASETRRIPRQEPAPTPSLASSIHRVADKDCSRKPPIAPVLVVYPSSIGAMRVSANAASRKLSPRALWSADPAGLAP